MRCPYGDHRVSLRCVLLARGLPFFSNLSLCGVKQNCRGHDARKSVHDDRRVSLQRPHGNGDLDIVGTSYSCRKANVTDALSIFFSETTVPLSLDVNPCPAEPKFTFFFCGSVEECLT